MKGKTLYHASPIRNIEILEPRISNHGEPRVYFSGKRENVLVYLSNAVEKYCKEMHFSYEGTWHKWASYGFSQEGKLCIDEYYPNALYDTYKGVSGYIYMVNDEQVKALEGLPQAFYAEHPVSVESCEYIEDAYEAILEAKKQGFIIIRRYEELSETMLEWIERTIKQEYKESEEHPEYRFFLKGKFAFLS